MIAAAMILSLVAAAPAPSPANDDATRGRAALLAGEKLYAQGRYLEAIEKFEEAYQLIPRPEIALNIGHAYEQLNDIPNALLNYREYLKASPEAKDKQTVTEAIARLDRRLLNPGVQELVVRTSPKGASVVIDGKSYGATPASVELKSGSHLLNVSMGGFDSIELSFEMPADKPMELSFGLKATAATQAAASPLEAIEPGHQVVASPPPTPPPAVVADAPSEHTLRGKSWIPAAAGAALLITGGVFYGMAKGTESGLRSDDPALANAANRSGLASAGSTQQTAAFVLGGAGIVAVAAATTMFFLRTKPASLSVIATPNMAAAVISGAFP